MKLTFPVSLLFTPDEVLVRGFRTIKGLPDITTDDYNQTNITKFKEHFGPSPSVIAVVWSDILASDLDLGLDQNDRSECGFKKLLTALHFLWAYPKNASILASTCGTNKRDVEGERLWKWVKVLDKLKAIKIVWPAEKYNDPNGQIYLATVDGTDMKTKEKSTAQFNVDRKQYTKKFAHGGLKYEIAIDAFESKIVWINGPFCGGKHDKTIFSDDLLKKIPEGKLVVTDRGYSKVKDRAYMKKLSLPNNCDSKELGNFKARLRARHESLNGRLKDFMCLDCTYRHAHKKHGHIFNAVCVLVQYEMDLGSPIFDA